MRILCILYTEECVQCTYLLTIADRVFDEEENTNMIHKELISPIIHSAMKGIHGQYSLFS